MPTPRRRALLYARLSLTTEESVSIERQLVANRRYAQARGWEVIGEEVDDGVSATRKAPEERPGWQRILAAADGADVVVVWKVDRLARRVLDFLNADRALQSHGAGLVAVEDPIDMTTAQGRAFATMLAVFGEMEAAAISARAKGARAHLVSVERAGGGPRPWPYQLTPVESGPGFRWTVIPERADAIRWAASGIIEGRLPIREVEREFERRGMPIPRSTLLRVLRSPVLAGATIHHGEPVRNPDGTMRISPERVILDPETWRRLQRQLDDRPARRPIGWASEPTLVGDLVRCAGCHKRMHPNRSSRTQRPFYTCSTVKCEAPTVVTMEVIDEVATRAFLETFGDLEEWAAAEKPAPESETPALLADALEHLERALAGDLEDEELLRLHRARRELRARIAAHKEHGGHEAEPMLVLRSSGRTFGEAWEAADGDVEARAALLGRVWQAIEVRRGVRGLRVQPEERFVFLES